jgi:N-acetylmuramoyl-L-alanine amidase
MASAHCVWRLAATFLLLGVHVALAQSASVLRDVRFWSSRGVTRVAMETSGAARFEHKQIQGPPRVYVDLYDVMPNTEFRGLAYTIPVDDGVVKQIRVAANRAGVTRVVLDLADEVEVRVNQLTNPDRVILDVRLAKSEEPEPDETSAPQAKRLAPAAPAPRAYQPPRIPPPSPVSLFARNGPFPPVKPPSDFPVPLPSYFGARLRVTRPSETPRVPPAVETPRLPPSSETRVASAVPVVPPAASTTVAPPEAGSEAIAAQRTRRGSQSLTRALGLKLNRVMLDPGHGGYDHGTSVRGLVEKHIALDVAKRLGKLLEENMGTEVIYTRTDDRYVALEKRPQLANEVKADLFLSIHVNSSSLRGVGGAETFYLDFTSSRTDMEVAARENATSEKSIHELQDLVRQIASQDKAEESREFASRIQRASHALARKATGNARNRGVKRAPFVVLIGAAMPSVLAEIGFITNPNDEARLRKPEQRQKIAEALFEGIKEYAKTLSHFSVAQRTGSE